MAKKPVAKQTHTSKSRPVSFRIDRDLLDLLDAAAVAVGTPRNKLVCAILREYLDERGALEAERIVQKQGVRNANDVSIFA